MHYNVMSAKAERIVNRIGAHNVYATLARTPQRPEGSDRDVAMRLIILELTRQLIPTGHVALTTHAMVRQAIPTVRKVGFLAKLGELMSVRLSDWNLNHSVQALAILDSALRFV